MRWIIPYSTAFINFGSALLTVPWQLRAGLIVKEDWRVVPIRFEVRPIELVIRDLAISLILTHAESILPRVIADHPAVSDSSQALLCFPLSVSLSNQAHNP